MAHRTILVVDDEPHIRSLVKSVLARDGHDVLEAADGAEAIAVWERSREAIDLLLTDVVMPRMDGLELAQQLSSRAPRVRVLYMSGRCEIDVVQEQIKRRGFGFIRKPFDIGGLSLAVTRILDQPPRKEPAREGAPRAKAESRHP
jgi:DNA-binding NtrC family response regulator